MNEAKKRGGKREGAGRPREGEARKRYTIYIEEDLMQQLTHNIPDGQRDKYITKVLKKAAKKDKYYTPPEKK